MGYHGTVFFLASISQIFAVSAPIKVLSVCDAFRNLDSLDGKMVTVCGVFAKETHGVFLSGENCGVRGKYVLPGTTPSMLLAMPDEAIDQGARRPHFRMDPKSILELEKLVDLSNRGKPAPKIVVNGEVSIFRKFSAKRQPDGGYIGNGFGPYGRYSAIIVIKKLREDTISR